MAERRMFAKSIIQTDTFLDLPASTQALYFLLGLLADDDGFLSAPLRVVRMCGAGKKDLDRLLEKGFLLRFDSGAVVIRHWRSHNAIRKDRYHPSSSTMERSWLILDKSGQYQLADHPADPGAPIPAAAGQPRDNRETDTPATQDRIGEDRKGKVRSGKGREGHPAAAFVPPTLAQVKQYCQYKWLLVDPERCWAFYQSKGWMI